MTLLSFYHIFSLSFWPSFPPAIVFFGIAVKSIPCPFSRNKVSSCLEIESKSVQRYSRENVTESRNYFRIWISYRDTVRLSGSGPVTSPGGLMIAEGDICQNKDRDQVNVVQVALWHDGPRLNGRLIVQVCSCSYISIGVDGGLNYTLKINPVCTFNEVY